MNSNIWQLLLDKNLVWILMIPNFQVIFFQTGYHREIAFECFTLNSNNNNQTVARNGELSVTLEFNLPSTILHNSYVYKDIQIQSWIYIKNKIIYI